MNEREQAKLLEAFLLSLRRDATTPAPPGLDPTLAEFARKLARERLPAPGEAIQARVWERALAVQKRRPTPNGRSRPAPTIELEDKRMIATRTQRLGHTAQPLTLIAALAVVVLGTTLLVSRPPGSPETPVAGQGLTVERLQDSTATPAPSPTSTMTPTITSTPIPETGQIQVQVMPTIVPFTVVAPPNVALTPLVPDVIAYPPNAIAVPGSPVSIDPAQIREIPVGSVVEGTLTFQQPAAAFRFVAPETGPVSVRIVSDQISGLTLSHTLIRADGSGGGGGGGGGSMGLGAGSHVLARPLFVTRGDQVMLFVSSTTSEEGPFTLTVRQIDAQEIEYGESVEGAINAERTAGYYTFEGQAGDVVTVRAQGIDGFDVQLAMRSTNDQYHWQDDDGGPGFDAEIYRERLPLTATYEIVVLPSLMSGGRYTLTVERETPLSLDDGPQTVRFNTKFTERLTFNGQAGETVQLDTRLAGESASVNYVQMHVVQNGTVLTVLQRDFGQGQVSAGGRTLLSGTVTIPTDGVVEVELVAVPTLDTSEGLSLEVTLERES